MLGDDCIKFSAGPRCRLDCDIGVFSMLFVDSTRSRIESQGSPPYFSRRPSLPSTLFNLSLFSWAIALSAALCCSGSGVGSFRAGIELAKEGDFTFDRRWWSSLSESQPEDSRTLFVSGSATSDAAMRSDSESRERLFFRISNGILPVADLWSFSGGCRFIIELEDWGYSNHKQQEEEHHNDAEDSAAFTLPFSLVVFLDPVPRIRHDASFCDSLWRQQLFLNECLSVIAKKLLRTLHYMQHVGLLQIVCGILGKRTQRSRVVRTGFLPPPKM